MDSNIINKQLGKLYSGFVKITHISRVHSKRSRYGKTPLESICIKEHSDFQIVSVPIATRLSPDAFSREIVAAVAIVCLDCTTLSLTLFCIPDALSLASRP